MAHYVDNPTLTSRKLHHSQGHDPAITITSLIVNGFSAKSEQRWFYEDRAGKHQPDFKPGGVWKTIMTFPDEWAPESSAFL